jgi:NAD(P)H-dependent FMN reductase
MKRLALNGSPRGSRSNSRTIIGWIIQGMTEAGAEPPVVLDLARTGELTAQREAFLAADEVILVFPLYTDSVPGILKNFIDSLAGADPRRLAGKRFAFVVQSGFPESIHSEPVAAYLDRLSTRLGFVPAGRAIRGNSEGLRLMPDAMTRKARELFAALGRSLVHTGRFDEEAVRLLGRPRRLGVMARIVTTLLMPTGLMNFYWNMMLKKHGAYARRFDRPYASALTG